MIYWPNQFFTTAKVVWYGIDFTVAGLLWEIEHGDWWNAVAHDHTMDAWDAALAREAAAAPARGDGSGDE